MKPSEILCKRLSFSIAELKHYVSTAPYRYKKYKIPKRNGGFRDIAQPSKDLKVVQHLLINEFLMGKLSVHSNATAYKTGSSILENARPHLSNQYFLKLDFENFFPSIVSADFVQLLCDKKIEGYDDEFETNLLSRIFFMHSNGKLILSIGSPGSPLLSNSLLYRFDEIISDISKDSNVAYTRYSDDLTFSTNVKDLLFSWPNIVKEQLEGIIQPSLKLNQDKTVFTSKRHNRHVTGITISNDGKASLGRKRKRNLRTEVFLAGTGRLPLERISSLKGYLAYAKSIEPQFVQRLWEKYPEGMNKIML